MKKLFELKNKKNKGFTLVELIIVVAIIAVLAAVLAPQYLRYVERSRQSNDLQVATSIMRATQAAVADPLNNIPAAGTIVVTWATGSETTASGQAGELTVTGGTAAENGAVLQDVAEVMGWTYTAGASGAVGTVSNFNDAESSIGNTEDFRFSLEVATGNITLDAASSDWVAEIGVDD